MKVKVSIVAFAGGKAINKILELELKEGSTLMDMFNFIEKRGDVDRGFFKTILSQRRPVTVLLNGMRVNLSEERKKNLSDGDEISIVSPIAGG